MRQPYQLSIALRYLRAKSRNGFISLISLLSMVGIGLAVAVLIVVLSVMNGFEYELQHRTLGMVSDATLTGLDGPLGNWQAVRQAALARNDVVGAAPFVEGEGMAMAGNTFAGVAVRGIDPQLEPRVSSVEDMITQGDLSSLRPGAYHMIIGTALAEQLQVGVGDSLVLLLAQGRVTPVGIVPRMRSFEVAGIFDAGMLEYDRGMVFIDIDDAARLFQTNGKASGLRLAVTNIYEAGRTVTQLARQLGGGFYVSDWTRQHANLIRSIQLTKTTLFIMLSLVIGVAAFNIVSTLIMVVRDKRGDIAILRSFGASPRSVMSVFASQGTLIGLAGIALGLALAFAVMSELDAIVHLLESLLHIDLLPADVYSLSDLPTRTNAAQVAHIVLLTFGLAVAATLYPSLTASRQPPAEALRYE